MRESAARAYLILRHIFPGIIQALKGVEDISTSFGRPARRTSLVSGSRPVRLERHEPATLDPPSAFGSAELTADKSNESYKSCAEHEKASCLGSAPPAAARAQDGEAFSRNRAMIPLGL
jgi:hypothetical protein